VRLEGLEKFKHYNYLIGTRTRDLPACGIASHRKPSCIVCINFAYVPTEYIFINAWEMKFSVRADSNESNLLYKQTKQTNSVALSPRANYTD
jgi:hypothetical protein